VCIVRRDGAHISTLLLLVAWDPNADQVGHPTVPIPTPQAIHTESCVDQWIATGGVT
jgi:hypothetical protein